MARGGARQGAGRKPKADEITLIENMDAVLVPESVWQALADKVTEGDVTAIKTWLRLAIRFQALVRHPYFR